MGQLKKSRGARPAEMKLEQQLVPADVTSILPYGAVRQGKKNMYNGPMTVHYSKHLVRS